MAKYGALISLPNGNPFITPDSTPMTLYRKVTVNSTLASDFNSATASVVINGQKGGIVFARTSAAAKISASKNGNTFSVSASNYRGSSFVLEAYFLLYIRLPFRPGVWLYGMPKGHWYLRMSPGY